MKLTPSVKVQGVERHNPCLQIAIDCNISANQLPGIIFLTALNANQRSSEALNKFLAELRASKNNQLPKLEWTKNSIYFPLKAELFEEDLGQIESVLSDLFSLIQDARKDFEEPNEIMNVLRKRFTSLQRRHRNLPFFNYLKTELATAIKLPWKLVELMASIFMEQMIKQSTIN